MSNTTDKIQQTVENTRYVFASTDMTAIYSFVIAAVIGVFLAWWYGKKSFDLTTKSFDITVEQIKASIEAAKENTNSIIAENRDLISNQETSQKNEFKFRVMQDRIASYDNRVADFLSEVERRYMLYNAYAFECEFEIKNPKKIIEAYKRMLDAVDMASQKTSYLRFKLELILGNGSNEEQKIIECIVGIVNWLDGEYLQECFVHKEAINFKSEEFQKLKSLIKDYKDNTIILRKRIILESID